MSEIDKTLKFLQNYRKNQKLELKNDKQEAKKILSLAEKPLQDIFKLENLKIKPLYTNDGKMLPLKSDEK